MVAATLAAAASWTPTCRKAPRKCAHRLASQLDGQIKYFRSLMESAEPMADDDLDQIDQALELLEPQRRPASEPSAALTREARLVAYGERYDRHEDLWCPVDAVQLRRRCQDGEARANIRFGVVEVAVMIDGKVHVEERAVAYGLNGQIEVFGGQGGAA